MIQVRKRGRYWDVWIVGELLEALVCVCVYKKGALEVKRRLEADETKR